MALHSSSVSDFGSASDLFSKSSRLIPLEIVEPTSRTIQMFRYVQNKN